MKNLKAILFLFIAISVFASCRKPLADLEGPRNMIKEFGEKVIYIGKHPECIGALLFQRMDGSYLRATNYPDAALELQEGDTVFIVFEKTKLQNPDGIEFSTLPIEISGITPNEPQNNGLRHGKRNE